MIDMEMRPQGEHRKWSRREDLFPVTPPTRGFVLMMMREHGPGIDPVMPAVCVIDTHASPHAPPGSPIIETLYDHFPAQTPHALTNAPIRATPLMMPHVQ